MADDGDFARWLLDLLERHSRDIRWRALPEPRQEGGHTVTHEGILALPDVGCVHAYRLAGGEAVFNCEDLDRVLGLDDDDFPPFDLGAEEIPCAYCGEAGCEDSCTGALLAREDDEDEDED